jgi:hypothetical protein
LRDRASTRATPGLTTVATSPGGECELGALHRSLCPTDLPARSPVDRQGATAPVARRFLLALGLMAPRQFLMHEMHGSTPGLL